MVSSVLWDLGFTEYLSSNKGHNFMCIRRIKLTCIYLSHKIMKYLTDINLQLTLIDNIKGWNLTEDNKIKKHILLSSIFMINSCCHHVLTIATKQGQEHSINKTSGELRTTQKAEKSKFAGSSGNSILRFLCEKIIHT